MVENNTGKDFLRKKVLSYQPDFDLEVLEIGLREFHVSQCKSGDFILRAGEICKSIFMVENSITRCYFVDQDGEEKTIWLEKENNLFTEYESFSSQSISRCDICCYEYSTVYSVTKDQLTKLYAEYHDWSIVGLLFMEEHYVKLLKFRNKIRFNNASENYEFVENYFAKYLDVIPLKHLASLLNISPVHLSRIRKERIK